MKKRLLTVFNEKLLKTLYAYSIIDPDSYKKEYDEVQGLVNEYNEIIRRRHAVKTIQNLQNNIFKNNLNDTR